MQHLSQYRFQKMPRTLKLHKRQRRLIRIYGDENGNVRRRTLNKKGISNALLTQLELAGILPTPLRVAPSADNKNKADVLYSVAGLRSCGRALWLRGLRVEFYCYL